MTESKPKTPLEKIRAAEIGNILKKINSGKTLTASERDLVKEHYSSDETPEESPKINWTNLSILLGVSRVHLTKWRKNPDAPRSPSIEAWRKYIDEKGLNIAPNKLPTGRDALLREKLMREIALLDIKVSRERRQIIASGEIDKLLSHIASRQRAELLQFADTEAITLAGIQGENIGKMRDLLKGLVDRQCDYMEDGIKRWMRDIAK